MPDTDLRLTEPPSVTAQMGIRRPPAEVFAAFVEPAIITKFWIQDSTGRLEDRAERRWTMNADGAVAEVLVTVFEPDQRIEFDWGADGEYTRVEIQFLPWAAGGTHVRITETGLTGNADERATRAADSTGGFTMVLCSLKALLEHNIQLKAVTDRTRNA